MKSFCIFLFVLVCKSMLTTGEDCGPIGFNAQELLGPNYWFLDLNNTDCPPIPPSTTSFVSHDKLNSSACRVYFNLCQNMNYQCYGTVCVNYLDTVDFIARLGIKEDHPFIEGEDDFAARYSGDTVPCKNGLNKAKTQFKFQCSHTNKSVWSLNVEDAHGGTRAPRPVSVKFDNDNCEYTLVFNYTGACYTVPTGDSRARYISIGSLILILFFPGIFLYFIMGMLLNRARGKEGSDLIPHRTFWVELPELIIDGFGFTMAIVTCRKEDRYLKDYVTIDT